ncbi:hypothetical protein CY34DRAFT_737128 [Suillus luteus UH-Slu-Lm8-n1]|uniref:Unplaced genomic scaffold CY34scaffold_908, whole genome shotgun sequence n=1 Tax=Suillus luteus UH-Slu-Lm8-n1 TaxID=930992 RepID=A0A0D0AM76_9AGAM|nr:hypothetical protein CY34DRAFT_737128 [Suillus luteus UH-Slu-Lm8-n1]
MGHYSPDIFLAADQRYVCEIRNCTSNIGFCLCIDSCQHWYFPAPKTVLDLSTLSTIDSLGATKTVDIGVASLKRFGACVGAVRTIDIASTLLRNGFLERCRCPDLNSSQARRRLASQLSN